jgi:hypothetical protein
LTHARGEQPKSGAVERAAGSRELGDDICALAAVLDHLDDAAELALNPAQASCHLTSGGIV